jgi:hypothetical protein
MQANFQPHIADHGVAEIERLQAGERCQGGHATW